MRRILISGFVFFGLPLFAAAQHMGATVGSSMRAAPMAAPAGGFHGAPAAHAAIGAHPVATHSAVAGHPVAHTGSPNARPTVPRRSWHPGSPVSTTHRSSTFTNNTGFNNGRFGGDGLPAPGLGFDYTHFFATHPNFGRFHHTNGFILPFFGGGIYVPYPYYADLPTEEEQAADYQPNDAQDAPAESADNNSSSAPAPPPQSSSWARGSSSMPALQAQPEYVFVRRDGTVFFAVAFSWSNDKLQYITKEGFRRSVPRNTLDLDATQQFNDQRGISFRLPA
jgi:hypothetical protein